MNGKSGYLGLLGALAMMVGFMSEDIRNLHTWNDVSTPAFVANQFAHFAAVVLAFIGGKVLPGPPRNNGERTRSTDDV